jgi:SHS2 domain-containing protein
MDYEFLEHTADAKFLAYGNTLEEAFSNVVKATTAIMTDVEKVQPKIDKEIKLEASSKESLLYDFIDELIFLLDTEAFIAKEVKKIIITIKNHRATLHAVVLGDCADGYDVHTYIKSPTYNDMFIKEEQDKVTIQMVHDI